MPIEDAPALEDGSQVSSAPAADGGGWLGWLADRLIRWRVPLFLTGALLVALAVPPALRLQLDESIESFYSADDPHLLDYQQSKRWFGGDEFVLVAYHDPQLLETEGLERLRQFSEQLSQVPGVNADSTQDLSKTLRPPEANFAVRLFLRLPTTYQSLLEFSRSILIGEDNETTAIVLRLLPEETAPVPRKQTLAQIRRLAAAHDIPTYVAGEPVQVNDMFRYVRQDGALLGWATSGMLIVTILVLFRSLRWMLLPLLIVHAALIWTKAILVLSGMKLSMVSSILTSLITIIGIATVTHVTVRFRELRHTYDRVEAFRQTFIELAPAVFWTCATTAIGFAALLSSGITPVRSFGTMVALGTLLVLVGALFLLPGGALIGRIDADPRRTPAEGVLLRGLDRLIDWVEQYSLPLLTAFAVLSAFTFAGLSRLTVETNFIKNFRQSSPIVKSIEFFEERLGGVGTWEVNFPAPQESPAGDESARLTQEVVESAQHVSEEISAIRMPDGTGPTKALSLGDGTQFIPGIAGRTLEQKRATLKLLQPEFEQSLYNPGAGRMRIVVRALEQQPAETKLDLIHRAETIAQQTFPEAKATGLYVLLAHLIQSLLADQLVSFSIAAVGIALMMSIAFRSLPIGLMSLIPNVFPILLVIGMMGWLGVPINIGTAMIASVSMGLTVDSTIHYLARYRTSREQGLDHFAALRATHASVGRAVIFASAALILGFTVLTLSHFIPLIYFGVLVSAAMAGGLLGSLILLPLLLKWFEMPLRQATAASSATAAQTTAAQNGLS
jgi:uncharacterized protein